MEKFHQRLSARAAGPEGGRLYQIVKINTMSELLEMASDQPLDANGRYRGYYLYRGLPDASFELKTSLQRNCGDLANMLEPKILANFKKYTATEARVNTDTVWKRMILGEHHGLPTRLLDWTHSPFVALNFATDSDMATLDKNDCAIWRIDIAELHRFLPRRFRDVMEREGVTIFSVDMLNEAAASIEEYDRLTAGSSMVIMEPPSVDPRIVSQYAFFSVVPGQVHSIEDFLGKHTAGTVKYVIDKDLKWRIRDFLDESNISERTVFPGLDGICKWLARHYYVRR